MKAEQHQQQKWRIHLQARSKNIDFKFNATKYLPTCYNFLHFSLFLKISSLLIRVNSNNNQSTRRYSLKSKINGFIKKFRSVPTNRKCVSTHKSSKSKWVSCEGPICGSTVVIGNLALLIQSIYEKDMKGIIVHCLSICVYMLTQLKIIIGTKRNKLLLISILVMVAYRIWLLMANYSSYGKSTFASRYIWRAWNWVIYHGVLRALSHVILIYFNNRSFRCK